MSSDRWYIKEQGSNVRRPIFGFDDDGRPLAPEIVGDWKARPVPFDGEAVDIDREGPIIPAAAGWYVLYGWEPRDGLPAITRRPVIAWEASNDGDAFVVNDYRLDNEPPIASV